MMTTLELTLPTSTSPNWIELVCFGQSNVAHRERSKRVRVRVMMVTVRVMVMMPRVTRMMTMESGKCLFLKVLQ